MSKPTRRTLADQIRDEIRDRGMTPHAAAKLAGVNPSVLTRFFAEDDPADIRLSTADALAGVLGLRLAEVEKRGRGRPAGATRKTAGPG